MKRNIDGTTGETFQLGLNGPNLKNNSGIIECRNSNDTGFANIKAKKFIGPDGKNMVSQSALMLHDQAKVLSGGKLKKIIGRVGIYMSFWAQQSPAALGDSFQQYFFINEGTYNFKVLGHKRNNKGIVSWYIDDISVGQMDWYSNFRINNIVQTLPVTINTSGHHLLKGIVEGKNPASTGYIISLTKYNLETP